jgi:two-component system CitB family response regulator/two-component system response regulator DcuR
MPELRVLIVEDDPRIAELHTRLVAKVEGFSVVGTALNCAEAREMAEVLEPDLLLLDLYLPDGNGMDLLHELRARGQAVDVILITAAREVNAVQQALRNGAFDYLVKPVMFPRFEEALHNFATHHSTLSRGDKLEQRDIDRLLHPPSGTGESQEDMPRVPKGIDLITLNKIRQVFATYTSAGFSAEEVGELIGASRSTARRYLEYMTTTGEVYADVVYGSVGRPERHYFAQR